VGTGLFTREKLDHESKLSPPFSGQDMNEWSYTSTPLYILMSSKGKLRQFLNGEINLLAPEFYI
jgi:hypothetical protein